MGKIPRVAEVFLVLALLQDHDTLAELRGAVGGDEARDASPITITSRWTSV
jgi:hypothetical protein